MTPLSAASSIENIPYLLSSDEENELSKRALRIFNKEVRILKDFCGNFYASRITTALHSFSQKLYPWPYNKDSALARFKELTQAKIESLKNEILNDVQTHCITPTEIESISEYQLLSCSKCISIYEDSLGNFYAQGSATAIDDFFKRKGNKSYTRESVLSQLIVLTQARIEETKRQTPQNPELHRITPTIESIERSSSKRKHDQMQTDASYKNYVTEKWSPEESNLLETVVSDFKINNPLTPFWDNPLSEVDDGTWYDLYQSYQMQAGDLGYKKKSPANIKSRWKEVLCPSIIQGSIKQNSHEALIIELYNKTDGDVDSRNIEVTKSFCISQNGRYYPRYKITKFLRAHFSKDPDTWLDVLCDRVLT